MWWIIFCIYRMCSAIYVFLVHEWMWRRHPIVSLCDLPSVKCKFTLKVKVKGKYLIKHPRSGTEICVLFIECVPFNFEFNFKVEIQFQFQGRNSISNSGSKFSTRTPKFSTRIQIRFQGRNYISFFRVPPCTLREYFRH